MVGVCEHLTCVQSLSFVPEENSWFCRQREMDQFFRHKLGGSSKTFVPWGVCMENDCPSLEFRLLSTQSVLTESTMAQIQHNC